MGYSVGFTPTKEFMEELKKGKHIFEKADEYEFDTKTDLLVYCMGNTDNGDVSKICGRIRFMLRYLREVVKNHVWKSVFDEFDRDGDVSFCGWEHSHEICDVDYKEVSEYVMREMVLLKHVKTPDYFEESEKYYEKVNEINSKIEYFVESCVTITDYEVMDELDRFRERYDDDYEETGEKDCAETESPVNEPSERLEVVDE